MKYWYCFNNHYFVLSNITFYITWGSHTLLFTLVLWKYCGIVPCRIVPYWPLLWTSCSNCSFRQCLVNCLLVELFPLLCIKYAKCRKCSLRWTRSASALLNLAGKDFSDLIDVILKQLRIYPGNVLDFPNSSSLIYLYLRFEIINMMKSKEIGSRSFL